MYEIKKEKQFVMFTDPETQKTYKVNINTGEFIGLRGKPIKTVPTQVRKAVENRPSTNNVLVLLNHCWNYIGQTNYSPARLMAADRLDSAGITITNASYIDQEVLDCLNTKKGLATLIRLSKEHNTTNLYNLMGIYEKEKFFAQYPQYIENEYKDLIYKIYCCYDSYTNEDKNF